MMETNHLKRGKTRATKLQLISVLPLISWKGGTSFLDQSQGDVKKNQDLTEKKL